MSEAPPPAQPGSLTDLEGGKEGRHLVQWLRASLSTERGVRKAAQRSVASLESRVSSAAADLVLLTRPLVKVTRKKGLITRGSCLRSMASLKSRVSWNH
jgi:hypothetical protein